MNGVHVAIIMDGNGRWAKRQGRPRWRGHLAGIESVRAVIRAAPDLGVDTLTLYAFSADNWKRPRSEVFRLFALLRHFCRRECAELCAEGVRVSAIGRRDRLPAAVLKTLEDTERATASGRRLHLRLAIDYSARTAMTDAVRWAVRQANEGALRPEDLSPDLLDRTITRGVAAPDILIRTAGEQRLSDFLLWEVAYTELIFTNALWPDFRGRDLAAALEEFAGRERRYGGLPDHRLVG
jgi:undecaprenyl diphosphate synthase